MPYVVLLLKSLSQSRRRCPILHALLLAAKKENRFQSCSIWPHHVLRFNAHNAEYLDKCIGRPREDADPGKVSERPEHREQNFTEITALAHVPWVCPIVCLLPA
jgi:hypothetical protein